MSMSLLATTPGKRLVMPRSSTAAGGLDALMAHSPRGQRGLRGRAGVGDASAATPCYTRRVDTLLWLDEGVCRGPLAEPGFRREPSGQLVLTVMVPSTIFFFASSSLGWMSSMKPPLVERLTPPLARE